MDKLDSIQNSLLGLISIKRPFIKKRTGSTLISSFCCITKGVDIGGTFIKVFWEDGRKEKHYIKDISKDKEAFLERIKKHCV